MTKKDNETFVSDLKNMYKILGKMIKAAEKSDRKTVIGLNENYQLYEDVLSQLDMDLQMTYSNCRNSCVSAVGILASMHEEIVAEAKRLYSLIPKP
ncbi:MAG TPA: hypothetical protein VJI68_01875 [Candidatus Nanoarchaeia archaeon]|nr:hypothetical protein [Candidatus Nanoarchaeia archaeon]